MRQILILIAAIVVTRHLETSTTSGSWTHCRYQAGFNISMPNNRVCPEKIQVVRSMQIKF